MAAVTLKREKWVPGSTATICWPGQHVGNEPLPDLILLPGLPVKVRPHLEGARQSVPVIPRDAVPQDQSGAHVLVVHPTGLFERRAIVTLRGREGLVPEGGAPTRPGNASRE